MARVFKESFKIMAVELSYIKGFVSAAALELGIDAGRIFKWRMDPDSMAGICYLKTINYLLRSKNSVN